MRSAGLWLHMQADRDLWQAMHDVDVTKIQPLTKAGLERT
jgi:plasmid maintenance system antidote protein VapI